MDLSQKLGRLQSAGPGSKPRDAARALRAESTSDRVARVRDLLSALIARQQAAGPRWVQSYADATEHPHREAAVPLPGQRVQTTHGAVHVHAFGLAPDHCHGRIPIAKSLLAAPDLVACLARDSSLASVDLRRMLFIDTETTGLSGGTGTIPFLIGLAWFDDQSLRIEQLFLTRPGEELPMLRILGERIQTASVLVTYNGKSFDLPLLLTRFILYRLTPPPLPPHLDLLHCARRIYRRRLKELRLVRLEEQVLGMRRERDIEGYEIPAMYWSFVREREYRAQIGDEPGSIAGGAGSSLQRGSGMARVMEHNANDLVALSAVLAEAIDQLASVRPSDDPRDHLSLAEVAFRAGDGARALCFAEAAANGGGPGALTAEAHELAARLHLKARDPLAAKGALLSALDALDAGGAVGPDVPGGCAMLGASRVHLKLAKLFEHKLKDLEAALEHARRTAPAESPASQGKRIARLDARRQKSW